MEERFVSYECYSDVEQHYQEFLENILISYCFPRESIDKIECAVMDTVFFLINEILEGIIIGINNTYTADKLHEEYFKMNGWTIADENKLYE